jgi:UDP-N-acetylmuramyl pentapeptide phosphotransferase/UDP-N-acetylglucosamine-1-phosphate transferase
MSGATLFSVAAATAILAFALTALAVRTLAARAVLDIPTARSSHVRPTPRGAGLAVVTALAPALLFIAASSGATRELAPMMAALLGLAVLSFLDDVRSLNAGLRLAAQAAAVALGLLSLPDGLVLQGFLPFWLDRLLVAVAWLWFVNLYNFMDGIDGITAVETISIGLGVALVASFATLPEPFGAMGLAVAAAAAGFLPWNWHPAKIFLGDAGSVPLGYLLGFLLISLALHGLAAAALALPLYYLADATITLLKRLVRGERVWQAHREHWYQRAAATTRHDRVSLRVAAANVLLVAAAVAAAVVSPAFMAAGAAIVAGLIAELQRLARRRPDSSRAVS